MPAITAQLKAWKLRLSPQTVASALRVQACFERVEEGWVVKEVWRESALMGYPCPKGTSKGVSEFRGGMRSSGKARFTGTLVHLPSTEYRGSRTSSLAFLTPL